MNPPQISSLPRKYQSLLDLAQERYKIHVHLLEALKGGRTGALLYLVGVTPAGSSHIAHYILKLDTTHKYASMDEGARHKLVLEQAPPSFTEHHVAQLEFETRQGDCTAVFYSIAGGSLLQYHPLAFYERQNQLESIFRATNDYIIGEWNQDFRFERAVNPWEILKIWSGYRITSSGRIGGFIEEVLQVEADVGGFLINSQVYPNPLSYSRDAALWGNARPIDTITGFQHGDLNITNILVRLDDTDAEIQGYYLIDFALYQDRMPLLFDQRYLEMSYLVRELGCTPFNKWVSFVCGYAEGDSPNPQAIPVELAGACSVINAGRFSFRDWVNSTHPSMVDDLWGQFWLAGAAAGLNFCNKGVLSNRERLAGLIYAAAHLKRYCTQFDVPLPVEVSALYDPGIPLHKIPGEKIDSQARLRLPGGKVTFLFSDIAGSTKLWETYPKDMPAALQRHDAAVVQAVGENNGCIFKRVGDGIRAAFGSAFDALKAAAAGQRMLLEEAWEQTGPLQVRMALYTGEADQSDGDYFGPAVNRAARLLEAAHGGQILLSQSVWERLQDEMPPGFNCLDLGEHWLKDIQQSENIFQVLAPGLPAEFPPLRTSRLRADLLEPEDKAFVGRRDEIKQITNLLQTVRLVTLYGPGGIGKTRLAQAAAQTNTGKFRHGIYFVPLLSVDTPTGIVPAIASAIGLTFLEGRTPQAQLLEYLQSRQVLLVLDNMEQLLVPEIAAGTLDLVESMLSAAPDLKMMVTSRELLRIAIEQPFYVHGLSVADQQVETGLVDECAVELFTLRAREVQPSFDLEQGDNLHHVQHFCLMVEGMPLAIELAAAQMRLLPLEDINSEIKSNLEILDTGLRGQGERHGSIKAVFETSWMSLNEDSRAVFSRLSVFKGGFTREAAFNIAGASIQQLTMLMDKSFIGKDAHGRFTLHALLQMFAAEKLAVNPLDKTQAQERHFDYYREKLAGLVEQWRATSRKDLLEPMRSEVDNLRAAWKWILASGDWEKAADYSENLWHFFKVLGRLPEIMEMLEGALLSGKEAEPPPEPIYLARWERHIGQAHLWLSQLTQGDDHFRSALSYLGWSIPGNQTGLALGLLKEFIVQTAHRAFPGYFIGKRAEDRSNIEEAYIAYENIVTRSAVESDTLLSSYCGLRSLNLSESGNLVTLMARAYTSAGFMCGLIPSFKLAESYFKRAEKLVRQTDSPESRRWYSLLTGYYSFGIGEIRKAEQYTTLAVKLSEELGKHWEKENALILLLGIALFTGDWKRSLELKDSIVDSASERGDEGFLAAALYWEATINLNRGEMDGVIALLEQSASAPYEVMMVFDWLVLRSSLARSLIVQGNLDLAEVELRELDRLLSGIVRPSTSAYIHGYAGTVRAFLDFAEAEINRDNLQDIQSLTNRALDKFQGFARLFPIAQPYAWLYRGKYEQLFGNPREALAAWVKSLEYAEELDLLYQQGLAHYQIGCHLAAGERTVEGRASEDHLQRASEIFAEYEALYDLRCAQEALGELSR